MLDTAIITEENIASIPFYLGYEPEESVFAVWLNEDKGMVLAQRCDLSDFDKPDFAKSFVEASSSVEKSHALILTYSTRKMSELYPFVDDLGHEIEMAGMEVEDMCAVNGVEYRSYFAPNDELDNQPAMIVELSIMEDVSEMMRLRGYTIEDKSSIDERYMNSEDHYEPYAQKLEDFLSLESRDTDYYSDAAMAVYFGELRKTSRTLISISVSLHDLKVRDRLLWHIAKQDSEEIRMVLDFCTDVIKVTPTEFSSPIYTVAAICAWQLGNGALANVLLGHSLKGDPSYGLSLLIKAALEHGIHPSFWKDSVLSIDPEDI